MQEAGRILLMPKGDYSASATYEMLDLVNHSGASWVCKKECTGQEPSDSNTEFWQRFGTAVDLSNYFPKSGGTLSAPGTTVLSIKNTRDGELRAFVKFEGAEEMGRLGFNGVDVPVVYSSTLGTRPILHTGNMADHVLPLSGGTVQNSSREMLRLKNTSGTAVGIGFYTQDTKVGELRASASGLSLADSASNGTLLHTGNKPTGTYTGNGSATSRTVDTKGIGNAVLVTGASSYAMLVTKVGGIGLSNNGDTPLLLSYAKCHFENGILTIATDSATVNANGGTYAYQVL